MRPGRYDTTAAMKELVRQERLEQAAVAAVAAFVRLRLGVGGDYRRLSSPAPDAGAEVPRE